MSSCRTSHATLASLLVFRVSKLVGTIGDTLATVYLELYIRLLAFNFVLDIGLNVLHRLPHLVLIYT